MSIFAKYTSKPAKPSAPAPRLAPVDVPQITQTQTSTAPITAAPQKGSGIVGIFSGVKNAVTGGIANIFSKYTAKPASKTEQAKSNVQTVLDSTAKGAKIGQERGQTIPYSETTAGITEATIRGIPDATSKVAPAVGGFAADIARYPARSAIQAGLTLAPESVRRNIGQINPEEDFGVIGRYGLGKDPIRPLQETYQEGSAGLEEAGYGGLAKPVALLGTTGAVALDLLPFGNLTKRGAIKLAGAVTEQVAETTARREFPKLVAELEKKPEIYSTFIRDITKETNPERIESILKNAEKEVKNARSVINKPTVRGASFDEYIKTRGIDPDSILVKDKNNFIVETESGKNGVLKDVPIEDFGKPEFQTLNQAAYTAGRKITSPIEATLVNGKLVITDGANRFTQAIANGDKTIPTVIENFDTPNVVKKASKIITAPARETKSGKQVALELKKLGSDRGVSDWLLKQIEKKDFELREISIDYLKKNDPDLEEYLLNTKGKIRSFSNTTGDIKPVIYDSQYGVYDGYNRIAQAIKDGKKSIRAYISTGTKNAPVEAFAVGTTAGIEQDEEGNLSYDPVKGVLGSLGFGAIGLMARRRDGVSNEELIREWDKVVQKEVQAAEKLPRSRRVYSLQSTLGEAYKVLGMKADEVFTRLTTEMELAEAGSRVFTGSGADREVTGVASTFPKWVPEDLRSRELFDRVLEDLKAPDNMRFNEKLSAVKERRLMNVFYDQMDRELDVNTKPIRESIIRAISKDGRLEEKEESIINRLLEAQQKYTEGLITRDEKIEEIRMLQELKQKELAQKLADASQYAKEVDAVKSRIIQNPGLTGAFRNTVFPTKSLEPKVRAIVDDYIAGETSSKEIANAVYEKFKNVPKQDFKEITEYQAGKNTPWIKEAFDDLFTESNRRGLEVAYRSNYIPQVYAEAKDQVDDAIRKFLTDKGMTAEQMNMYMRDVPLSEDIAKRLGIDPRFGRERVFPDYATAIKYGLTPRYKTIAEHIAWYRENLESAVNNRQLMQRLVDRGELLNDLSRPNGWVPVNDTFTSAWTREALFAHPDTARVLNNMFPTTAEMTSFGPKITGTIGGASRFLQDYALSSGVPLSTVNFFATSYFLKNITEAIGNTAMGQPRQALNSLKTAFAYIRANSNTASQKWFSQNMNYITMMADEGIDIGRRIGTYDDVTQSLVSAIRDSKMDITRGKYWEGAKDIGRMLGRGWDKTFNEKTFRSMLPQMQVQTFKNVYQEAIRNGLSAEASQKLAAETLRKFDGIITEKARGRIFNDVLRSVFFAPKFREQIINFHLNTYRSLLPRNWSKAEYSKNRAFFAGALVTFALYQVLQKALTGKPTWENGSGNELNLAIPLEGTNVEKLTSESDETKRDLMYVTFLPSMMTIPRNLIGGATALFTGDIETAGQKFGSFFSIPVKLATELWSNSDYFGRPIYKDTDTVSQKASKMLQYAFVKQGNPIVGETTRWLQDESSGIETLVRIAELPVKFSKKEYLETRKRYEMLEKAKTQKARNKEKLMDVYNRLMEYKANKDKQGFDDLKATLSTEDLALLKEIDKAQKTLDTNKKKNKYYPVFRQIMDAKEKKDKNTFDRLLQSVPKEDRRILKLLEDEYKRVKNYQ